MHETQNKNSLKLFDGKTLDAWTMVGKGNFIVIENEKSLSTQGGMGLLWYHKKKFKDFILSLEWKISNKSDNSGVFVRFPEPINDPKIAIEKGYEIQIDNTGSPDGEPIHATGGIYNFQAPSKNIKSLEIECEVGNWNIFEISVIKQLYSVTLNNEKVVTNFVGNKSLEGFIGLQNHDDKSKVFFRNIRIKELQI